MSRRDYWNWKKPNFERFHDPNSKPSPELEAVAALLNEEGIVSSIERSSLRTAEFGICCLTVIGNKTFHLTLENGDIIVRHWDMPQTRRSFPLAEPDSIEKAADFMRHL